jgi:UDP-glucose 4-epimerase
VRIVITGGAGFIGSALANFYCSDPNNSVISIDNYSTGDSRRQSSLVNTLELDLVNVQEIDLINLFRGADVIFHLAAVKLHNLNNSYNDLVFNNVHATNKVLKCAGIAGIKKIVFTSSLYAYGLPPVGLIQESTSLEPLTLYGATKVFGENLVRIAAKEYGFNFAIARLFFIYGPLQFALGGYKSVIVSNFEKLKTGESAKINGDGKQVLDYLYISDCVEALVKLADHTTNDIFNVSSGSGVSIDELTIKMLQICNSDLKVYAEPDWTAGTYRVGSNSKLKQVTGWEPKVSLDCGLRKTWESLSE